MKITSLNLKTLLLVMALGLTGALTHSCKKEEGCTDPNATNYDADAEEDDGSCKYDDDNNNNNSGDNTVTVKDDGNGTGTTTWSSDSVYILDGFVFVNSGQTLTIEPGTVIKGKPGQGSDASALIVAKGGTIMAKGTKNDPIIFTAEADDLNGSVNVMDRGLWGGVIILGDATLNSQPNTTQIEGIPTNEPRGEYGGSNDNHDAGVFKYVSIRHGGSDIGAGNEINGLTLGGVGSGTEIHHVEVISNQDDGVEWFGGAAEVHHVVTAFCGDDAFDYDEGWHGKGQFFFAVQDPGQNAGRGGEHDGGTSPEDGQPYSHPVIYNATYIGRGASTGDDLLFFRDNAGGEYHNSLFANWASGVKIEDLSSGEDSYKRFNTDNILKIEGCVFYNVGANGTSTAADKLYKVVDGNGSASSNTGTFETYGTNNNTQADPGISTSISQSGGLNPVPSNSGNVSNGIAPTGSFYEAVTYKGAFDPSGSNWAKGWTQLDAAGYLD